ncbi:hypothetical protein [Pseudonocardia broussonetiae]|uniref:Uncharacterized protein n=1 Tax=Pseudonocardia broussonetiae TaxID=2736640 RepID=A0A6M6JDW8_9PSEU|nr:hypothetical protein [Pseudonocardia broussonetiae]QJY45235.1 hypothetical protein HOP40_04840 [Pseudonocardia broussonetiae]
MSRFRIFGRSAPPPPYPAPPYGAPVGPAPGAPAPWPPGGVAPSAWAAPPPAPPAAVPPDPPTDPFGFPPIPAVAAARPDPSEAAALAGAFAVDYLSWDEDDPARRGRVLRDYLPTPGRDPERLGWSGSGRQRAEFALPGLVRPDGEGRVLVDVRVRVTPYRAVGEHGPDAVPEPDVAGTPAVAPAPTGRGWRSLASYWIRISVPVAVEGGRLVVDAWEETLGEEPPAAGTPAPRTSDEHLLADDDPLAAPGSAW